MTATTPESARYQETRKVTLIGSVVDLLLGVAKIVVGFSAHSQALIADGVHSLSDLATDFMVLFAAKHASKEADEDHPYGHARFETLMTVGLGIALILVAAGLAWDAIDRLFNPGELLHPGWPALVVAALSIVSKEAIYHYTMYAAKRLRSNLLRANAWHSRSDAISSVVVLVGVAGAMAGLEYLDAVAAVGVALMIAKIGWDLSWHSIRELVDTGLDPEQTEQIRRIILGVDGVKGLHFLRSRRMGPDALVDVHIQVEPRLSVSEGHQVSETVRQNIIDQMDEVADVLVHIDPENDEREQPNRDLPPREVILRQLREAWSGIEGAALVTDVVLHYLHGKVHVDIQVPLDRLQSLEQARELAHALHAASCRVDKVGEVQIHYLTAPELCAS